RLESGALRMLAYGTEVFAANEIIATIHTVIDDAMAHKLTLTNIMASDFEGRLYSLPDSEVTVNHTCGLDSPNDGNLSIAVDGHTVIITASADTEVLITDMKGITTRMEITAGVNRFTLPNDGVYMVNNQKIIIR
ncbi:MAG: hypothetical protein K2K94_05680, partial [Muribaculaceae bacterium]|nr:hypothetical protein [Muribaculaceae bacterium]